MKIMRALGGLSAAALVFAFAGCGADDEPSSGDPLADAFADQLVIQDRGSEGGFSVLHRSEVICFATGALGTLDEPRRAELMLTIDNIPLLREADWTDQEIDTLTGVLDGCFGDDTATATAAFALFGLSRNADCLVPATIETLGDRYYLEPFRASFTPPRIQEQFVQAQRAGQPEPDPTGLFTLFVDMEPVFAACDVQIGLQPGDDVATPACDEACAEEEDANAMRDSQLVVLVCSRDPYVPRFIPNELAGDVNAGLEEDACIDFDSGRVDSSLGSLVAVQRDYPCPQGTRQIRIEATDGRITEQATTVACAKAP